MVDTRDLKSLASNEACRFKSGLRHFLKESSQPPCDTGLWQCGHELMAQCHHPCAVYLRSNIFRVATFPSDDRR